MTPELKTKWIEALRSGRYTQTEGRLKCQSGFCCIGVLLDVAFPEDWMPDGYSHDGTEIHTRVHCAFGLDTYGDELVGLGETDETTLIEFNDDKRWDFNAIADWIEANVSTS